MEESDEFKIPNKYLTEIGTELKIMRFFREKRHIYNTYTYKLNFYSAAYSHFLNMLDSVLICSRVKTKLK